LGYTFLDKIIFSKPSGFGKIYYTKNILVAWQELRKLLVYEFDGKELPGFWAIDDAISVTYTIAEYNNTQQAPIVYFMGKLQVIKVKDLWCWSTNSWKDFTSKIARSRGLPDWVETVISNLLTELHKAKGISPNNSHKSTQWSWRMQKTKGIQIAASKVYHIMLNSKLELINLNR
jgi:hypothetical protein